MVTTGRVEIEPMDKGAPTKSKTLEQIFRKMETLGDLPVFSATVNHICCLSADPTTDAMQLSQEVLKDANLSLKLLRLSNSPVYARGTNKINVVSRSIIILGFETVKNLCLTMKFIESFQNEHPNIDMDRLLVQSFISATFARELAIQSKAKNPEHSYTCALLNNLGEIAVSYFLPEQSEEISRLNKQDGANWLENERSVLGCSYATIGKELATSWDFSPSVVATMGNELPKLNGGRAKSADIDHILAKLSAQLVSSLYSTTKAKCTKFQEIIVDLSKATGTGVREVEHALTHSFEQSCELARDYGLNLAKLSPNVEHTEEDARDRFATQFHEYVSSQVVTTRKPKKEKSTEVEDSFAGKESTQEARSTTETSFDTAKQLRFIQEITDLITQSAKLNTVLVKVLEGIHHGIGYQRVALCLLTPDRKKYVGRILFGDRDDQLKLFFNRSVDKKADLFSKIALDGNDVVVEKVEDPSWRGLIPSAYSRQVGGGSFIVSALRSGIKPLGFIYADTGEEGPPLTAEQHRGFLQFVGQARLALQTCR